MLSDYMLRWLDCIRFLIKILRKVPNPSISKFRPVLTIYANYTRMRVNKNVL